MATNARAIFTAAAHTQDAWERGNFPEPNAEGYSEYEWQDGRAAHRPDGWIWVEIPNRTRHISFLMNPITGEVTGCA